MSNVRVQVEDTTVTISWSDCAHLEKKSGGNYNPYYSFVYRPDTPNQKVILLFNDSENAQRFEDCVLYLTETPPQVHLVNKLGSTSAFQETRIYSLYDQDDPDRGYHGIVYAKKSPKTYHFSQICYIYRDLDFSFLNQNASEIELQNVRAPQYISSRHKMLSRPKDSDPPPVFREVTSVFRPVQLTFSTDDDAVQFLSGLTGWRLKFYKQCAKLVATDTSHFHKPKKTYKNAEISLWEKSASEVGSLTQLLVRLPEMDRPWITAMRTLLWHLAGESDLLTIYLVESSGGGLGLPSGGVAELRNLVIQQGKDLDTKYMKANSEETNSKHCWKFTITFKIAGDSNDFLMKSGLVSSFAAGLGLSLGDPRPRFIDIAQERSNIPLRMESRSPTDPINRTDRSTSKRSSLSPVMGAEHDGHLAEEEFKIRGILITTPKVPVQTDQPLTPVKAGPDPLARLRVPDTKALNLTGRAMNEHSASKLTDVQHWLTHSDTSTDAAANPTTEHWSLALVAWCLPFFSILGVREVSSVAGKIHIRWSCVSLGTRPEPLDQLR
ncbi:MAG: hypothetical protein Q9204_003270 [Flavoplaca sp. TL-2023a]